MTRPSDFWPVLLPASGGVVLALVAWWRGRRGDVASATDVITQAAARIVADLRADNERLRAQVAQLTLEVHASRVEIAALQAQIVDMRSGPPAT